MAQGKYTGTLFEGKRGGRNREWAGRAASKIQTLDQSHDQGELIWVNTEGVTVVADVQTVTSDATGGTFTLATAGDVTGTIAWNASTATVETAIETLDEYTAATVTGEAGAWVITSNDGAGLPGETLVVDNALATGGTAVNVHTTTGVANVFEVVSFWVDGDTGSFKLSYGGQTTAAIAYSANAALIVTRLEAISTITDVTCTGAGTWASPFVVTFADPAGAATAITADTALLTKTVVAAARAS